MENGKIANHMDVSRLVQQKLTELGLTQRDTAEVTESYIYYYRALQNLRDPLHFRRK